MTERIALTEDAFSVALDQWQACGDPRPLQQWAKRALQGGGWAHVEAFLAGGSHPYPCEVIDGRCEEHVVATKARRWAAELALTEHRGSMPATLERALVDGWCFIDRSVNEGWLNVWYTDDDVAGLGLSPGCEWDCSVLRERRGGWSMLTEPERKALLAVWPSVVAWKEGAGVAPWEQRVVEVRTVDQTGVIHEAIAAHDLTVRAGVVFYDEAPTWEDHILDGDA